MLAPYLCFALYSAGVAILAVTIPLACLDARERQQRRQDAMTWGPHPYRKG